MKRREKQEGKKAKETKNKLQYERRGKRNLEGKEGKTVKETEISYNKKEKGIRNLDGMKKTEKVGRKESKGNRKKLQ